MCSQGTISKRGVDDTDGAFLKWVIGLWLVLVLLAILNGILRQSVLIPAVGASAGRVLSTIILSSVILLMLYAFLTMTDVEHTPTDLWLMGVMWVAMTIAFEFGFGHFVMGRSWDVLLEDYNVFIGRIWVLVLITELVGPYLVGRLAG